MSESRVVKAEVNASLASKLVLPVSGLLILGGLLNAYHSFPDYFTFKFNVYALLPAIEAGSHLALLTILFIRKGYVQARLWLAVDIAGALLLGICETLLRLSTTLQQALFWSHLSTIGMALIPIGFYMFSQTYFAKNDKANSGTYVPAALLTTAGFLIVFNLGRNSLSLIIENHGFWGYSIPLSMPFCILSTWTFMVTSLGLLSFINRYRHGASAMQKKQLQLIIGGVGSALITAFAFDIIPRYLGYRILPIGILSQIAVSLALTYAIYKYDAFSVDFSAVGSEVVDSLSEVVVITSSNLTILAVNRYGITFSGFDEVDLVGKPLSTLFSESTYTQVQATARADRAADGVSEIAESQITTKSGAAVDVSITVAELKSLASTLIFTITDISEIKQIYLIEQKRNDELQTANEAFRNQQKAMMNLLEDSRDLGEQLATEKASVERKVEERTAEVKAERMRLEASINSLNVGFIIVDSNKRIITANRAFTTIIDPTNPQATPSLEGLAHNLAGVYDINKAIQNCLVKGKQSTNHNVQYGAKMLRIFMAPIFEDSEAHHSLGVVVLVEDITEAKAIERSRDEFFSIASHELRTPLTAIRGNTQMIKQYYGAALADPLLAEMVDDIHDSSIRLISIVNDFLDTSRLEQGKINFELTNFDVAELIADIIKEFQAGEVSPNLYIKLQKPEEELVPVRADHDRLKQTIINLIGNALKFTDKGGVTIAPHVVGKTMCIEVTDTGKGIPVESQNLLFRKFQQASNNILTRDSTRSTGLGLYISKLIAEGMKGKIYMKESALGKGSTFVIEVPLADKKAARTGAKKVSLSSK